MRTYQRLAFARGGSELGTINPAYPHNFLITDSATGTLKIGNTGTRYNSLQEVGKEPQTFVPSEPSPVLAQEYIETETLTAEQPVTWPIRKTKSRKKKSVADDSEGNTD